MQHAPPCCCLKLPLKQLDWLPPITELFPSDLVQSSCVSAGGGVVQMTVNRDLRFTSFGQKSVYHLLF